MKVFSYSISYLFIFFFIVACVYIFFSIDSIFAIKYHNCKGYYEISHSSCSVKDWPVLFCPYSLLCNI